LCTPALPSCPTRRSSDLPALLFALALVVAVLPGGAAEAQTGPGVNILRADYFTNYSGTFVNIEAKADVDTPQQASALTVTATIRSEEHTSELQSRENLVC